MNINETFAISMLGMDMERFRLQITAMNVANINSEARLGQAYRPLSISSNNVAASFEALLRGDLSLHQAERFLVSEGNTKSVHKPESPLADQNGMIEVPDINPLTEMLAVMTATRSYEANAKAFNASRLMVKEALKMGQ